jgi:bifunctional DNA-binding transcriptional regulator/antitoxin component of YhaV-PrlF toxin-antitoxin module
MTSSILANGLIEIPESFRQADDLRPGQHCEIERVGQGEYRVKVRPQRSSHRESLVKVLLDCPVKGFFVPLDRSETTDELKPLSFE